MKNKIINDINSLEEIKTRLLTGKTVADIRKANFLISEISFNTKEYLESVKKIIFKRRINYE